MKAMTDDKDDDGSLRSWEGRIRSRMNPDNHSLAISLTTKLNLR